MKEEPAISDDAILKATGRSWREWFGVLDSASMRESSHDDIIDHLREKHGVPAWWQRNIANEYEGYLGRRDVKAPVADGFQLSVSCTLDLPADVVYSAWADESQRLRWLRRGDFTPETLTAPRTVRGKWQRGGSRVDVTVEPLEGGKCRLEIEQRGLSDAAAVEEMRRFWKNATERLKVKFL